MTDDPKTQLEKIFASIAAEQQRQLWDREKAQAALFPDTIHRIYCLTTDRYRGRLEQNLRQRYDNNGIFDCISHWTEESYRRGLAEIRKRIADVDAMVFLCYYLCDGESPYVYRQIGVAEELKKPFLVGYTSDFCFKCNCPEIAYMQSPERTTRITMFDGR